MAATVTWVRAVASRSLTLLALIAFAPHVLAVAYPEVRATANLRFPQDHGAHPRYRTEWWYLTAWVRDTSGQESGIQITFFRSRPGVQEDNPELLAPKQLIFAQVALADARFGKLLHDQRAARELPGVVYATEHAMDLRMQDWRLMRNGSQLMSSGTAKDFAWDFTFEPTQAVMRQGNGGFSRKGPDKRAASYYYSEPQLRVSGQLTLRGEKRHVSGAAWFDHEWFSEMLPTNAVGWDWVGINFDDGRSLMAFRIRDANGQTIWSGGQMRGRDGRAPALTVGQLIFSAGRRWTSPRTKAAYPVEWHIQTPTLDLSLSPMMDDQELDGRASHGAIYWEGAVRAIENGRVSGRGYMEMTGYAAPIRF